MALLGSSVDPRLFMQDYSGFTRAAEIQAQGMQNLGALIGQGIKDFGEARQERKKLDASIKANRKSIESALKLGESLGIDVSSLNPILEQMDDPNVTPIEAAALGQAGAQRITDTLNLGIDLQNRADKLEQAKIENLYRRGMLEASQTRAAASLLGVQQKASEIKSEEVPVVNAVTGEKDSVLINRDAQGRMRDPESGKVIKDLFKYGNEMPGWEAQDGAAMPTPTSQVGGSISESIANAAKMSVGRMSTASTPGTKGGKLGCADAVCRIFNQATGEELVPGGTLSTSEMSSSLSNDQRFIKVPLDEAQKGDIVLTPRGRIAGHVGIVVDNNKVVSNSSAGFKGGKPGTVVENYSIDSWAKSVAPRNPTKTAAYRYVGSQGIDNALAISGDMSQQAAGLPSEQAEIARMIKEGQGMAMAQNMPQGAIPTEPSIATQQPQLPQQAAPRVNRRLLSSRTQGGARFRIATPEEAARFGVPAGQIDETTGRFYPVSQPSGNTFTAEIDPKTGKVVFSQGPTKAQQAAEAEAKAEQKAQTVATGVTQDLYELKKRYTDLSAGTGPIPALSRLGASAVPGTPAAEVKEVADRVTAGLTIENIMSARRSNAAGAALGGSTSDKDMKILERATTSLNAVQNPEAFNREWTRIMEAQLNIAYGTPEQRARLVKENKITEEFNKEIEDLYPAETINIKGELVPRREKSAPNIKSLINPEVQAILDRFSKGQ